MQGDSFFKNMKRLLVVGGSIGASMLIVLAMLPAVVSAQSLKTTLNDVQLKKSIDNRISLIQKTKTFTKNAEWFPGYLLLYILGILGVIWWYIIDWLLSGFYP